MVVKIRFGRGPVVTRRKGKNSHIAMLAGSMLTMGAICFTSLGLWRLAEDVELTGGFIYTEGILSHWQVWVAAAVSTQYGAWRLTRYARLARGSMAVSAAAKDAVRDAAIDAVSATEGSVAAAKTGDKASSRIAAKV